MFFHDAQWLRKLICALTALVFIPAGCHATLLTSTLTGGGAGLDADGPSMCQVVLGYNVTSSRQ